MENYYGLTPCVRIQLLFQSLISAKSSTIIRWKCKCLIRTNRKDFCSLCYLLLTKIFTIGQLDDRVIMTKIFGVFLYICTFIWFLLKSWINICNIIPYWNWKNVYIVQINRKKESNNEQNINTSMKRIIIKNYQYKMSNCYNFKQFDNIIIFEKLKKLICVNIPIISPSEMFLTRQLLHFFVYLIIHFDSAIEIIPLILTITMSFTIVFR